MQQQAPIDDPVFKFGIKLMAALKLYHDYKVLGLRNIPKDGPALIAVSHSFATYETLLLGNEIYQATGRYSAGLADRRIFQTPGLSQFFSRLGAVSGTPHAGKEFLSRGNLLILSPGGMRESLRPSSEKYQVDWHGRLGFARLAIEAQVPVLLAACPAADDIFTLYENPVTRMVYQNYKWPLPLLRGWGPTLIPRPVQLTHFLSGPLLPPPLQNRRVDDEDLQHFHNRLMHEMQKLMLKR